jgi:hypothetical protein
MDTMECWVGEDIQNPIPSAGHLRLPGSGGRLAKSKCNGSSRLEYNNINTKGGLALVGCIDSTFHRRGGLYTHTSDGPTISWKMGAAVGLTDRDRALVAICSHNLKKGCVDSEVL